MLVESRMTATPLTIPPGETCDRAIALMDAAGIDHLVVCEGKRVVGLLQRRRLLDRVAALVGRGAEPQEVDGFLPFVRVSGVMICRPPTVAPADSVVVAAERLSVNDLTALPVVDEEGLVGILTVHDILLSIVDGNLDGPLHACVAP